MASHNLELMLNGFVNPVTVPPAPVLRHVGEKPDKIVEAHGVARRHG
jgi:hypothetical protein